LETHFLREAFQRPSLWRSLRQSLNLVFSLRLHAQACYTCAMDGTGLYPLPRTPPSVARGAYRPFGAFRLVLALMVVLQHLQYLLPDALRGPFHRMGFGALAVGVFFALSGFIVAEANDRFYAGRPWAFLLNRLLRVVPPYLAALAISAAVQAVLWRTGRLALWDFVLGRDPLDPALLAAGVLSLLPGFHTSYVAQDFEYIPFVWTLRVEMAFYLVAVAVAASMSWAGRQAGRVRGQVPAAAVAAGFAGFALYLWRGGPGLLSDVPFFLLGVCLYAALRRPGLWRGAAVLLAAGCAMAAFPHWALAAAAGAVGPDRGDGGAGGVAARGAELAPAGPAHGGAVVPAVPEPLRCGHRALRQRAGARRRDLRGRGRAVGGAGVADAPAGGGADGPVAHEGAGEGGLRQRK